MTAPKPETQALKAWCESTPGAPRYMTAYVWMRRNEASVEQTIERYSGGYVSAFDKCKAAGLSYPMVTQRMHNHGITVDEAIQYYQSGDKTKKGKCDDAGVSVSRVGYYMYHYKMDIDSAIERALEMKNLERLMVVESEKTGVSFRRIMSCVIWNKCTPAEAAKKLMDRDSKAAQALQGIESVRQTKANPEPEKSTSDLLSKAWV